MAAITVLALTVAGAWWLKRSADARAVTRSIAEIRRLTGERDFFGAFVRARELQADAPGNAELAGLWNEFSVTRSITSDPPGAEMAIAVYNPEDAKWIDMGRTPLVSVQAPIGPVQIRVTKPGYVTTEDLAPLAGWPASISLVEEHAAASQTGLVRAAGPSPPSPFYLVPGADPVDLEFPNFWIDRHETTNREYKAFVDAGGYQRRELWTHPFSKGGRTVTWDEAMASFRDATGRPGPSTWQAGTFPTARKTGR